MASKQLMLNAQKAWAGLHEAIVELQRLEDKLATEKTQLRQERDKLEQDRARLDEDRKRLEAEKLAMIRPGVGPDDFIGLNFRGEKTITVRRSFLCQVEGSGLAAMFSGRYDDQLEYDQFGNVYMYFPPSVMMPLMDWLTECRLCSHGMARPTITVPKDCEHMWDGVVKFFGLESVAQPQVTGFSGVKTNFKMSDMKGWSIAFCEPYSHKTSLLDFQLPGVEAYSPILIGARKTGTDELLVAAIGRLDVVTTVRTKNVTQLHNGVHWYCTRGMSMGFAPHGTVEMGSSDFHDVKCPLRLSWLLDGRGGWRAGSTTKLFLSGEFQKVIMTPPQTLQENVNFDFGTLHI